MFRRNIPLILFALVFVVIAYGLFASSTRYKPVKTKLVMEDVEELDIHPFYKGRVVMPDVDDLYVLENTAGRDVLKLGKSLQGRAAGLHWLATNHFRSFSEDILVGLKLSIDSTGHIVKPEIVYSNTKDDDFKRKLIYHISNYWVYPRSVHGETEFWFPVRWLANMDERKSVN